MNLNPTKISLLEVKQALRDGRFRDSLPKTLQPEVDKYLQNPGCACNTNFYRSVLKTCKDQLVKYYPGKQVVDPDDELVALAENHWSVLNCAETDLESQLRKLPPGRKQIAVARSSDGRVTCVINELDVEVQGVPDQPRQQMKPAGTWTVINCQESELQDRLRSLPPGRKNLALSRDISARVTCVVQELDLIY